MSIDAEVIVRLRLPIEKDDPELMKIACEMARDVLREGHGIHFGTVEVITKKAP